MSIRKLGSANLIFGLLIVMQVSFTSACESKETQGACVFSGKCSQGSSYSGQKGINLCRSNGGTWSDDGCSMNEQCLGKCDHGSYWVYYYLPEYNGLGAAKENCTSDSSATWEDGCAGKTPDVKNWFTTPCADMGGQVIAGGACFVECGGGCPVEQLGCGMGYQDFCRVLNCSTTADCGPNPDAWVCGNGCFMKCQTDSAGAQSDECPTGWSCGGESEKYCIHHIDTGSNCGEPCPKGCCSSTGLTCCQPPFCSGQCAGSPCCK